MGTPRKFKRTEEHVWIRVHQQECDDCGLWYAESQKVCPRCKSINLDKFNKKRAMKSQEQKAKL